MVRAANQIREFSKNQGISFSIRENQGMFKFLIVLFQSSDFLHSQPCIQLRMIVAKFCPLAYHSAPYSHFEAHFHFVLKPRA